MPDNDYQKRLDATRAASPPRQESHEHEQAALDRWQKLVDERVLPLPTPLPTCEEEAAQQALHAELVARPAPLQVMASREEEAAQQALHERLRAERETLTRSR